MEDRLIVVFSPHPDDETFACGGTIIKKLAAGYSVKVVFMTNGSQSHAAVLGIFTDPTPQELVVIRHDEAVAATAILGVDQKNLTFLENEDSKLSEAEDNALESVKQILSPLKSELAELYFPYESDNHADHKATYRIVSRAVAELGISPEMRGFVVWKEKWEKEHNLDPDKFEEVDISEVLHRKVEAIQEYGSQVSIQFPRQKQPVLETSFVEFYSTQTAETFWKLRRGSQPR
jgi:LmbE family N-acetylglucosaminyl deacetylase